MVPAVGFDEEALETQARERIEVPASGRKPPANGYSPFLLLWRQRTTPQIENVMSYLPEHLKEQAQAALCGAFLLHSAQGVTRLEKRARWLKRERPDAAASLREGLEEMFTIHRLELSPPCAAA